MADKAAFLTPALLDGKAQIRCDGADGGRQIMTVERQTRLQPQRIARAKTNGFDLRQIAQRIGQQPGILARHADFKTVLTGIARPADPQRHAAPGEQARLHEQQVGRFRNQAGQRCTGLRSLERQQGLLIHMVHGDFVRQMLDHPADIVIYGRAIDDHINVRPVERAVTQA